jgi:flagellin-like protein
MNKKGISVIIGYILLTAIVISLAAVIYTWMKNYVPKETLECPDEISIFIKDYKCSSQELNLTLKNNGKFNIAGYLIYATNSPQNQLATIDLSKNITSGGTPLNPTGIKMSGVENSFLPDSEESHLFDISSIQPRVYSIEIVPIRLQEQGRKEKLVTCINSKIKESLNC